jgi:hypothetical protein
MTAGSTNAQGALRHCADLLDSFDREADTMSDAECLRRCEFIIGTLDAVSAKLRDSVAKAREAIAAEEGGLH